MARDQAIATEKEIEEARQRRGARSLMAPRWRWPLMIGGPLLLLAIAAYFVLTSGRSQSTDDSYVEAARVPVSASIGGRVIELDVHENQPVQKGQVLFRLDVRDYAADAGAGGGPALRRAAAGAGVGGGLPAAGVGVEDGQRHRRLRRQRGGATEVADAGRRRLARSVRDGAAQRRHRRTRTWRRRSRRIGPGAGRPRRRQPRPRRQAPAGAAGAGAALDRAPGSTCPTAPWSRRKTARSPGSSSCRWAPTSTRPRPCSGWSPARALGRGQLQGRPAHLHAGGPAGEDPRRRLLRARTSTATSPASARGAGQAFAAAGPERHRQLGEGGAAPAGAGGSNT